jgi:N-methylhydantoinase A/oxoprolinase/acetone carboxylase beta subunit
MSQASPRFRIGIDTGGTFTDIVSVDTISGATKVTKVASTPANPGIALLRGVNEILAAHDAGSDDVVGLAHGTTVATNALLQGEINSLGLIVNAGFRHILEIARQSVPEGYGNSYFWVKPDRIVPLQFVREVTGVRLRVFSAARAFAPSASAFCIPTPTMPMSAAPPPSLPRNIRRRRCRCPAKCCRNIANMSAR